jgi:DUF1365 family protein
VNEPGWRSGIYRGRVAHSRQLPRAHAFTYRLFMMYLDLDELDEVFRGRWLWSARRPALAWFRRADYLGDAAVPLDEAVRAEAARLTGRRPTGPIRMLTHLRYYGYVQNPVTFYYCFTPDGARIETILAQITNTPWNERHTYAMTAGGGDAGEETEVPTDRAHHFDKAFHVSPFMEMDHEYVWRFSDPGETLRVHMENHASGAKVFDAALSLKRIEITGPALASALAEYPFMTLRVAAGIYVQALRLWLKRIPFYAHPAKRAA